MKIIWISILIAGIAAAQNPVQWTLSGAPAKPGRSTALLKAVIEPGWHLYGLYQLEDGPKATRIWVPEGQAFEAAGEVKSPKPLRTRDPNFNLEVEYYEGTAAFRIPVRLSTAPAAPLSVKVYFQSCNDKLCLPPRTVTVTAAR